jgi:soluble lytic murein transglycosylase
MQAAAAAAAYWLGRCYEKLDDPRTASRLYRNAAALANQSYYGQMAQQAADVLAPEGRGIRPVVSGADLSQALRVLEGIRVRPAAIAAPAGPAVLAIERARQLASAELFEEALAELRAASERYPEEKAVPYVAARIHERQGDFGSVIAVLHRAFPDYSYLPPASLPRELREMLFPVPYHDLVRVHAATEELDPSLVFGLIRQESAFKESAHSRANARGLMQIVPATGRRLARQAGLRGYSTAKLYQAGTNIVLGTRHLASLLQMFGGRMELALAAYNAGEQRAQRWKMQFGDTDLALFVEQVPFMETRHYIRQVLTNREHYRAILTE